MASLYFRDSEDEPRGVLACVGDDIDFNSSQDDAVLEVSSTNDEGEYVPMGPFGFTLNLEETKQLRDMLSEAIAKAEIANEYTD